MKFNFKNPVPVFKTPVPVFKTKTNQTKTNVGPAWLQPYIPANGIKQITPAPATKPAPAPAAQPAQKTPADLTAEQNQYKIESESRARAEQQRNNVGDPKNPYGGTNMRGLAE